MGFMAIQPLDSVKPGVFTCGNGGMLEIAKRLANRLTTTCHFNPLHPNPHPYFGLFSVAPKKNQWLFFSTPMTGHVAKRRTLWNAGNVSVRGTTKGLTDEKGKRPGEAKR